MTFTLPTRMRSAGPLVLVAFLIADAAGAVIERDVFVVGGGASGAHAGAKVRDMGKTFVLAKKRDRLVSQDAATARNV